MLDKKSDAVLKLLVENVGANYKVINKGQLLAQLPSKLHLDAHGLQGIITFLKEDEYIDVKYQDKDEICLSTTVKAASYNENEKNVIQRTSISSMQISILALCAFLASFAGALLAVLIGKLF